MDSFWDKSHFNGCEERAYTATFFSGYPRTESPIEALMGGALEAVCNHKDFIRATPTRVHIEPQPKIGRYRPDLAVYAITKSDLNFEGRLALIVECDGHDFHERNKDQAARDKQRDRWFVSKNITTMRFTGSEIFKDYMSCAWEVADVVMMATK